jgi:hypothetical protein
MSYNLGTDYGYDQINISSNDFRDFTLTGDANRLNNIDKINERETRLLQKINRFKPTCEQNRDRNSIDYYPPSLYSKKGSNIEQNRMEMRKNIEDYYFAGKEYSIGNCKTPRRVNTKSNCKEAFTEEGFNGADLQYLHDELKNIEKKNDMLLLFVFFLVIVVVVQYSKINNTSNPMQLMILPTGSETPENATGGLRSVKIATL